MTAAGETRARLSAAEWTLLVLLIVSIFLNYIDRGNLSVAAPFLEREFALTPLRMGSMFAAFFWTYSLLQLFGIAGWFADRFPVRIVLASGLLLWSLATMAVGFIYGFTALLLTRLLLGAGESVAYPCYSRILAADFPAHHRGRANALLDAGSKLGPALATFLGGLFLTRFGWRFFFVALGFGSLAWLVPWMVFAPRRSTSPKTESALSPATLDLLRNRSAWGTFLGHFCGNYFWFFLLTWLPVYLVKERGVAVSTMAEVSSVAFLTIAGATVIAGWISDRWIARGGTPTRVRKAIVVGGLAFSTIIVPVAVVGDLTASVVLLLLSCAAFGTYTSNHWAITQTLAGPLAAGRWTSLQNGIGNLSGIAASWVTGAVVERTRAFPLAFFIAAAMALTGALLWGVVVGPVRQVEWRKS